MTERSEPAYIYVLSRRGHHGADHLVATLDRGMNGMLDR